MKNILFETLIISAILCLMSIVYYIPTVAHKAAQVEILEFCKDGKSFEVNGVEVHCGIISKHVNMKAAEYEKVKQCIKFTNEWTDKNGKYNHFTTLKHHNEE
jgi:hypothetical protein